jgi:uncharacterized membrane protein YfcA
MSLANLPLFLYIIRGDIRRVLAYAAAVAITGVPMVQVGANLLFSADLAALKIFVGLFFLLFAVARLSLSVMGLARRKLGLAAAGDSNHSSSNATAVSLNTSVIETPPSISVDPDAIGEEKGGKVAKITTTPTKVSTTSPSSTTSSSSSSREDGSDLIVTAPLTQSSGPLSFLDPLFTRLHPISPSHSVRATIALCVLAGSLAGLLNGLLGTGGPPQMIAYALLAFDKDTIRAMSGTYGAMELPMRVYMFTSAEGNVFSVDDWPEYLLVAIAAWVGFGVGTSLRRFVDTDAVVRILLVLVFASSAILLGALENGGVAITYVVWACVWGGSLVSCVVFPRRWKGTIATWDVMKKCGGRKT